MIDSIIVGILSTIVAFIIGSYLVPFLIAVLYFTLGFGRPLRGRTLGKRMLGLRVIDMNGHVPNYGRALLRSVPLAILLSTEMAEVLPQVAYPFSIPTNVLAYAIDTFVLLGLLITVIFHPQKRGIHDMFAGTLCERVVTPRFGYVQHIPQPVSPIKIGAKLKIALVGIAVVALGFGIFVAMLLESEQEHPVITLWRHEGLVESAEFLSLSHQTSSGSFSTFEVRAVVPPGTLADEANTRTRQDRLMRDITFVEVDILVINLVEYKRIGFYTMNKYRWHAYPAVGKEEILEQARPHLELLLKGSESNIMYDHELSIGMSLLKHTFTLHFAMKP